MVAVKHVILAAIPVKTGIYAAISVKEVDFIGSVCLFRMGENGESPRRRGKGLDPVDRRATKGCGPSFYRHFSENATIETEPHQLFEVMRTWNKPKTKWVGPGHLTVPKKALVQPSDEPMGNVLHHLGSFPSVHTVHERNPALPKKPKNDSSPVNTNKQ